MAGRAAHKGITGICLSTCIVTGAHAAGGAYAVDDAAIGIRFAPTKSLDLDIIYGHNIAGETASWITAGLTLRFPN